MIFNGGFFNLMCQHFETAALITITCEYIFCDSFAKIHHGKAYVIAHWQWSSS